MSRASLIAVVVALAGGAVAVAAYRRARIAEDAARALASAPAAKSAASAVDADRDELARLAARVDALESRLARLETARASQAVVAPSPAAAPAAAAAPTSDAAAPSHRDVLPSGATERAARRDRQAHTVELYWQRWASEHGLTDEQRDQLAALEADATRRKLANQEDLVDGKRTQPETRTRNQAVTEDVRARARALLTDEQFARFEADKGAEAGSSYRLMRERLVAPASPPTTP